MLSLSDIQEKGNDTGKINPPPSTNPNIKRGSTDSEATVGTSRRARRGSIDVEQGVFAEMATAEEVGRRLSLGLVDGWMFKGLSIYLPVYLYLCAVGILFHVEWCIRQLWCSSTIFHNIPSITHDMPIY